MKKVKITLIISLLLNLVAAFFLISGTGTQGTSPYMPKKKNVFAKKPKSLFFMGKDLLYDILPKDSNSIIFLGDSHTEHFALTELLGDCRLKNRGISGDRLRGILQRLDPILETKPRKIFIQAGINDLGMGVSVDTIIAKYTHLIDLISEATPLTKIYVQSIFPVENKVDKPSTYCNPEVNESVKEINQFLKSNAEKQGYVFIDIYNSLVLDKKLNPVYSFDGIHLTAEGYVVWSEILKPYLKE